MSGSRIKATRGLLGVAWLRGVASLRGAAWLPGLLALLLAGCVQTPERVVVIPDSTLVVVLADLHLADARARLPNQAIGLRDTVLAFHGLNEAVFQEAMDSFDAHPEELTNLYNTVLDKLNATRSPTQ